MGAKLFSDTVTELANKKERGGDDSGNLRKKHGTHRVSVSHIQARDPENPDDAKKADFLSVDMLILESDNEELVDGQSAHLRYKDFGEPQTKYFVQDMKRAVAGIIGPEKRMSDISMAEIELAALDHYNEEDEREFIGNETVVWTGLVQKKAYNRKAKDWEDAFDSDGEPVLVPQILWSSEIKDNWFSVMIPEPSEDLLG